MNDTSVPVREILVVGAGMAAHRFVERLLRDPGVDVRVTVIGDEEHGPYDRSGLVDLLSGGDVATLQLDRSVFRDDRVRLIRDDRVLHLDPKSRTARTRSRRRRRGRSSRRASISWFRSGAMRSAYRSPLPRSRSPP